MNEKIKDSGSMQTFGKAHRDNPMGKGRCDLLPLKYVAIVMDNDPVLQEIDFFMIDRDYTHLTNAIRNSVKTVSLFHYDTIVKQQKTAGIDMSEFNCDGTEETKHAHLQACLAHMMLEVSKLYEAGANKYGANNWKFGMPVNRYIDSGVRHYLKTLRGDIDEPHYRGFIWNLLCAAWTCENFPESNKEEKPEERAK